MTRAVTLLASLGLLISVTGCLGGAAQRPDPQHLAREIEALQPRTVWADYAARHVTCTVHAQANEALCQGWLVRQAARHANTPGRPAVPRVGAGFRFRIKSDGDLGRPICGGGSSVTIDWAFCGHRAD